MAIFLPGTFIREVFMENTVKIWTQTSGRHLIPEQRRESCPELKQENGSWPCVHKHSRDDGRPPLLSKNTPLLSDGFLIRFRIPDRDLKPVQVNRPQNSRLVSTSSKQLIISFDRNNRSAQASVAAVQREEGGEGGRLEE